MRSLSLCMMMYSSCNVAQLVMKYDDLHFPHIQYFVKCIKEKYLWSVIVHWERCIATISHWVQCQRSISHSQWRNHFRAGTIVRCTANCYDYGLVFTLRLWFASRHMMTVYWWWCLTESGAFAAEFHSAQNSRTGAQFISCQLISLTRFLVSDENIWHCMQRFENHVSFEVDLQVCMLSHFNLGRALQLMKLNPTS